MRKFGKYAGFHRKTKFASRRELPSYVVSPVKREIPQVMMTGDFWGLQRG